MASADTRAQWQTQERNGRHKSAMADTRAQWQTQERNRRHKSAMADTRAQWPATTTWAEMDTHLLLRLESGWDYFNPYSIFDHFNPKFQVWPFVWRLRTMSSGTGF